MTTPDFTAMKEHLVQHGLRRFVRDSPWAEFFDFLRWIHRERESAEKVRAKRKGGFLALGSSTHGGEQ